MPIANSEIVEQTQQASGYRVKFKYTLDDGREYFIGPVNAKNQTQIDQFLIDKQSLVLQSVNISDAEEAKELGIKIAHKTATLADVYYQYLLIGYNEQDPLTSYESMAPVAQDIIDSGLTLEQMAGMFSQPIELAQAVLTKWQYLDTNKDAILAYKAIKGGM